MKFIKANREEYDPQSWLTFNDVLLQPQRSRFKSRNDKDISLQTDLSSGIPLNIPIISANMDTVTGVDMAVEMDRLGGLGVLHRFYQDLEYYSDAIISTHKKCTNMAFSVGCGFTWIEFVNKLVETIKPDFIKPLIVCLDVAHGHMEQSIDTVKELKKLYNIRIIAGNIATVNGALDLAEAGADTIKVGVGSGSVCSTRIVTGHGVPQLTAIMNISDRLHNLYPEVGIIADGGIKNSGDIVKALAAGADAVMLGNLLAGSHESPGHETIIDNKRHKLYRGQSSRHFLNDIGKIGVASEGESMLVPYKGFVKDIIGELVGGIRSGMTYSGAATLMELRENAEFIEITQHGWIESTPHALIGYR